LFRKQDLDSEKWVHTEASKAHCDEKWINTEANKAHCDEK
jgi:hypothetical protein